MLRSRVSKLLTAVTGISISVLYLEEHGVLRSKSEDYVDLFGFE